MTLSQEEKNHIIECINKGASIPLVFQEKLFPSTHGGEFLWAGKYAAKEYISKKKHAHIDLSAVWQDTLFYGDNLDALHILLQENNAHLLTLEGGVQFVYIDPPFAVGMDFMMKSPQRGKKKEQKILAYSDKWESLEAYYSMIYPRLQAIHRLLAEDGCLCLHCDWHVAPALRLILDEIFGPKRFINEVIWHYTGGGRSIRYFSRKHDNLLIYAKGKNWTFNADAIRLPYKKGSGYAKSGIISQAGKQYKPNPKGTPPDDVWDIPIINPMAIERVGYATQKPLKLLERLILALTNQGDIVADFFCGSGTTIAAATLLGRRWIACDQSKTAITTVKKRLEKESIEAHSEYAFYAL